MCYYIHIYTCTPTPCMIHIHLHSDTHEINYAMLIMSAHVQSYKVTHQMK